MASAEQSTAEASGREMILTRVLDAPRELVFKVWTEPQHVAQWWGPNGFTNTIHEMDVRPGGVWRLTMHGPDGVDYPNRIVFIEVVRPERLVYHHGDEGSVEYFHVTVTFADEKGKTRLRMRALFDTVEQREHVVNKYGALEGGKQTLGRLAEYLKQVESRR